ncbi:MAG TPA: RtcB family protein [Thermoanaerobaculia bacterium]|nr:RtcB family protein [Thermoanaerobaculia bacterium]
MSNGTALSSNNGAIFGTHDPKTLEQLRDVATRAERVALMADGHTGYVMPIGGVAAYRNRVSVVGVGFDIACGNAAIMTDRVITDYTRGDLEHIATEIQRTISFGIGLTNRSADAPNADTIVEDPAWNAIPANAQSDLKKRASEQLGTVGGGNHYVDVFADETGRIWVGVHFGSRGFGHTVASGFLALAANEKWGTRVPEREALLDLSTPIGDSYWSLMELGGKYAYAGREWVARRVVSMLGGTELDLVHNHHNFAWKEKHGGEELVVVRKGATPAFPGQRGFVGGSMGDDAVILEGTSNAPEKSEAALWSTVHGAGRVMSRTEARGKKKGWGPKARIVSPGKVSWQMVNEWLGPKGIILRGGGLDEAPQAYRRLPDVIAAQGETVRVLHTLSPLIVVMAGENEYDPYKD